MLKRLMFLLALVTFASPAGAATVAAWDFSQYLSPGFLSTDGLNPATTLSANYSDLDATQALGLGIGSDAFGTLFLDGSNGSTVASFAGGFTPANDLTQNNGAAIVAGVPMGSAAAFNLLQFGEVPGQTAVSQVGLQQLTGNSVAVFGADLSSVNGTGANWVLDFAGVTAFGGTSDVTVEVSTDGSSFSTVSTETITSAEGLFTVALSGLDGTVAPFVRLSFDSTVGATIDNVSLSADVTVPEPAAAFLGLLGALALARRARR